jgi:CRISPR-associated protein (TIGR03984 family)
MSGIVGCRIEPLAHETCQQWLAWILEEREPPEPIGALVWLLAHCESGVTWGVFDGRGWRLGSDAFPDLCPRPSAENILEVRLFWPAGEVLIWRGESGLRGRLLRDDDKGKHPSALRPDDEDRLLRVGRDCYGRDGFVRVRDGTGAEQALPLLDSESVAPDRLRVRHYFEQDDETGAVRVVATRLVKLVRGGSRP